MALAGQSGPAIGFLSHRLSGHQVTTTSPVLVLTTSSPDSAPSKGPPPATGLRTAGFWMGSVGEAFAE